MDRTTTISLKGQIILSERYERSLKKIMDKYKETKVKLDQEYLKVWQELLKKAKILQCAKEKGEVGYFVISLLHSSVLTKTYDFRFDLYDKDFYLDKTEICAYWSPCLFFESIEDDIVYFSRVIRGNMVQVTNNELEEFRMEYAYRFIKMAFSYFCENSEQIFHLKEYEEVKKGEEVRVLFGTYLGNTQIIATSRENAT